MAKNKWGTRVGGVKFSDAELEELAIIAAQHLPTLIKTYYKVLKLHKDLSFKLKEDDPNFVHKHRSYAEQSYGIRAFLKLIEEAPKKIEELEEAREKK